MSDIGRKRSVDFEGTRWSIYDISRGPDQSLWVILEAGDEVRRVPYRTLVEVLMDPTAPEVAETRGPDTPELAELPAEQRRWVLGRYQDLMELAGVEYAGRVPAPGFEQEAPIGARLHAMSARLTEQGETHCSPRTLRRQLKAVLADGYPALIHGNKTTSDRRLAGLDPELLEAARVFALDQQAKAKTSERKLLQLLRVELRAKGFDIDGLGRDRCRLLLAHATRGLGLHHQARSRKTHSNKPYSVYASRLVDAPGQLVHIDGNDTVIHCWDPDRGWVRTTILSALDCYSRAVLALRVVPGRPSARDIALLLYDIGKPHVTRVGHPYDYSVWHGLPIEATIDEVVGFRAPRPGKTVIGPKPALTPSNVVCDHGGENDSDTLFAVAARNGIDITFAAPRTPHAKGIVETWHRYLAEVQSGLPGFKGRSPDNHPDNAEQAALLSRSDLEDALWESIITIYHQRPHAGLLDPSGRPAQLSPVGVLEAYLSAGGALRVPDDPYRFLEFLPSVEVKLQDYGINLNRRVYNSAGLLECRQHLQRGVGAQSISLRIHYDPYDVSVIFVRHPLHRHWMAIPRAHSDGDSVAPYSQLVQSTLLAQQGDCLSADEQDRREEELINRWRAGVFTDVKDKRLAAIEHARSTSLARDRIEAPALARLIQTSVRDSSDSDFPSGADTTEIDVDFGFVGEWDELGEDTPW